MPNIHLMVEISSFLDAFTVYIFIRTTTFKLCLIWFVSSCSTWSFGSRELWQDVWSLVIRSHHVYSVSTFLCPIFFGSGELLIKWARKRSVSIDYLHSCLDLAVDELSDIKQATFILKLLNISKSASVFSLLIHVHECIFPHLVKVKFHICS